MVPRWRFLATVGTEGYRYGGRGTQGDVGKEVGREEGRDRGRRGGRNGGRQEGRE